MEPVRVTRSGKAGLRPTSNDPTQATPPMAQTLGGLFATHELGLDAERRTYYENMTLERRVELLEELDLVIPEMRKEAHMLRGIERGAAEEFRKLIAAVEKFQAGSMTVGQLQVILHKFKTSLPDASTEA